MIRRTTAGWTAAALCATGLMAARPYVAAAANPGAQTAKASSVTLTGCLHADDGKYTLTNLQGPQAPQGRSWKTGFVKKTAKDMEVVGSSSSVKLKENVGHRVTVVGLKDGETHMKAQSVKLVSRSCQ